MFWVCSQVSVLFHKIRSESWVQMDIAFPSAQKKKKKNMRESCEDQPHHAMSTDSECRALPNAEQGHAGPLIIRP